MSVEQADLEKVAQTLEERCNKLGYQNIVFTVKNGEVIGTVPANMDVTALSETISIVGLLEFVDFGQTPQVPGTLIATDNENEYNLQLDYDQVWHTIMTNEGIETAQVVRDQSNAYQVAFTLTDEGKKIFSDHTTNNTGTYLGIVLDKVIISAPIIQQPITNGQGVISGSFTQETANDLAVVLQTKPLPFPIKLK